VIQTLQEKRSSPAPPNYPLAGGGKIPSSPSPRAFHPIIKEERQFFQRKQKDISHSCCRHTRSCLIAYRSEEIGGRVFQIAQSAQERRSSRSA
jgi:hypothetical protein